MVKLQELEDLMRRYISGSEEELAKLDTLYWLAWDNVKSYGLADLHSSFELVSLNLVIKYGTSRPLRELMEELLQLGVVEKMEGEKKALIWTTLEDSEESASSYIVNFFEQALLKDYFEKSIKPRLEESLRERLVRILLYVLMYASFSSQESSPIDCDENSCLWKCCRLLFGEEIDQAEWKEAINELVRSGIVLRDRYRGILILPYVRSLRPRIKEKIGKIRVEFYERGGNVSKRDSKERGAMELKSLGRLSR